MDSLTPVITPIVQSLLVPIKKHLGFLVNSTNKARDMHSKVRELEGASHDMQTKQQSAAVDSRVVPHRVPDWLAEVEELIKVRAERIPARGVGCFNFKTRYKVGKDSYDILKHIDRLLKEKDGMEWPNEIVPISAVTPEAYEEDQNQNQNQNRFESRYILLNKALESLEPTNNMAQKMALCGMAGVGKTTMMEEMKKAASNRNMFDHIVKVVVGEKPNLALVQQTVEEQTRTGAALIVTVEDNKAEQLKNRFKKMSEEGKKKILVILDDVWQELDLKHIGLMSPLPTGFKLLLTSREESVCLKMGVKPGFIFKVEVLTHPEAKNLFWETTGADSHSYIEPVQKIGEDIIKRCGGLPIAIKVIASTLINIKEKHKWEDAHFRIQNQDFSTFRLQDKDNLVLINIFQFSYENLQNDEIKAVFLLSGLYPEDYDINIEELVMYGWGLQFFKNLPNIARARIRVKSYVDDLIRSNLLNKSEREGCVKMHDLVRDFVLISFSKVKQASIVNHANEVSLNRLKGEESYERILVNCEGMFEFPQDFNHPNLTLLKLMYGNELLQFPEDFYARMKKLEVLAYNKIRQLKLPQSLTNLRTLCLSSCSLVDVDISFLGDLINLEILALAYCGIRKLPSKIGNLRKLKLLDLSGCNGLCIDDGVFQDMGKLEELYMRGSPIRFMDTNCRQFKMLKLFALEFQFFKNKVRPINFSFDKIERFRISMGCELKNYMSYECSFKNTLKLVTSMNELVECEFNELFAKTEILHLEVNDMPCLKRILVSPAPNSFCMLKILRISCCTSLTYLFTVSMVEGLTELESLDVTSCPVLKSLVNGGNNEAGVITFHKLKMLVMDNLPELESLCDFAHIMELPRLIKLTLDALANIKSIFPGNNNKPLLKNEVVIPNLEVLSVWNMENLKEIWPCEITSSEEEVNTDVSMLREISVSDCNSLVNLFPSNPMRLLSNLEELRVKHCGSLEVLFKIDLGKNEQLCINSSLKFIKVEHCESFKEVCRIKDVESNYSGLLISGFQSVEDLQIRDLRMRANEDISVSGERKNEIVKNGQEREFSPKDVVSWSLCLDTKEIKILNCDGLSSVVPSYAAGRMPKLQVLSIKDCGLMTEIFETEEIHNTNIRGCSTLTIPRLTNNTAHQLPNLTILKIEGCDALKYVFTCSMLESLKKLKMLTIENCKAMKVIVREEYGDDTIMTSSKDVVFPNLKSIKLKSLTNVADFFLGMNIDFQWPLLEYLEINDCPQTMVFASGWLMAPRLKYIYTELGKHSLEGHISFQTPSPNLDGIRSRPTNADKKPWSFHNLIECKLRSFQSFQKLFPSNELQHLQKLEKVHASYKCYNVEEVFEVAVERINDEPQTVIKIPELRKVKLGRLENLKYIWKNNQWRMLEFPNLTKLSISRCSRLKYVFTCSMIRYVTQLKELRIMDCEYMKVLVKKEEEDCDAKVSEIKFPCLKSLRLQVLSSLEGFCLGNEEFTFESLDTLVIKDCPIIKVFTEGPLVTPKLTSIETSLGSFNVNVGEDVNTFIMKNKQEGYRFEWLYLQGSTTESSSED